MTKFDEIGNELESTLGKLQQDLEKMKIKKSAPPTPPDSAEVEKLRNENRQLREDRDDAIRQRDRLMDRIVAEDRLICLMEKEAVAREELIQRLGSGDTSGLKEKYRKALIYIDQLQSKLSESPRIKR
jgi:hypothetical protein